MQHWRRMSGGSSAVATTTTERASPAGPRSRSTNSRTSRPRSPTRQITLMSAAAWAARLPSRTLLPTPLPAKIPTRCPRPMGSTASTARIPVSSGSVIRRRPSGDGGACTAIDRSPSASSAPRSSIGRPIASMTRPTSPGPTGTVAGRPRASTSPPGSTPARSPSGINSSRPSRKPTTSAESAPCRERIWHSSPMGAITPVASSARPTTLATLPSGRTRSAPLTRVFTVSKDSTLIPAAAP